MSRVKICGITDFDQALAIHALGADLLGVVREPSSPRCADAELIPRLLEALPQVPIVEVWGQYPGGEVFGENHWVQASEFLGAPHGRRPERHILALRVQANPQGPTESAPCYLLDAFSPGQYGGTGHRIAPEVASAWIEHLRPSPVLLAGGLTPEYVGDVIQALRPDGVDVSSGVEQSPGRKDLERVRAFIEAAKTAFRA